MPKVFPFKSIRPQPEMAAKVSARIHGNETLTAQVEFVKNNPSSYLNVIKPQLHFAEKSKDSEKHFAYAKEHLQMLLDEGTLIADEEESIYVYKQTYPDGYTSIGVVAALLSKDYRENKIKRHENTRKQKEEMMVKHISATNAIGEPVLVSCTKSFELDKALKDQNNKLFDYEFECEEGVVHTIWRLSTHDEYEVILDILAKDEAFYIADGHHRSAASALYHKDNEEGKFLSYILPENQLKILPFHRLMTLKKDMGKYGILGEIEKIFNITACNNPIIPEEKGTIGLFLKDRWYELKYKEERNSDIILDVDLLEKKILTPCFNVVDSRTDDRLDYVAGNEDFNPDEFAQKYDAVFTLYPVSFEEVKSIADANKTMPPKSTWILPKLRSGLIIQEV
jgi:uncharacterized protein (DUF1015 family)